MRTGLFLNLVFSFLFVFHTSVQAATHPMNQVVEKLATMTNQEKLALLEKNYSKEDLAPLKKMGDWNKVKIPGVTQKDGEFTIKDFTFKVIKSNVISFKGQEIDLSPGKLSAAVSKLESLMSQSKTSLIDLFISSAYAQVLLVDIILGAILAILVVSLYVTLIVHKHPIQRMCKEAREKIDLAEGQLTADDYKDIEFAIDRNLSDISVASICTDSERKEMCVDAKKCLSQLKSEIQQRKNAVNNSGRDLLKDYVPPVTKEAWPIKNNKATQQ